MRLIGLAVILTVCLSAPLAGEAQQAARIARIGYLAPNMAPAPGANLPSTATTMLPASMVWTPESYAGVVEIESASPTWPPLVSST
jgi:hypothetical protein